MVNLNEFNRNKIIKLINNIQECNGNYVLYAIDVDDVVYNTEPVMQRVLMSIDSRATKKYREKIAGETSEDSVYEIGKSFAILDAILEETPYVDEKENGTYQTTVYPKINYEMIYDLENLMPNAISNINGMLKNRAKNEFFIYLSHINPPREGEIKTRRLYELTPGIDAVMTLPYHVKPGTKEVSSKADFLKTSLALDTLKNCILIDNSKSNGRDWRYRGGTDIRFLPEGHELDADLADRIMKLTYLDPYVIGQSLVLINYLKEHPDYNIEESSKKLIKK